MIAFASLELFGASSPQTTLTWIRFLLLLPKIYVMVAGPGPGSSESTRTIRSVVPSVGFALVLISGSLTAKDFLTAARTSASAIPNRASRNPVTSYLGWSWACLGWSWACLGWSWACAAKPIKRKPATSVTRRHARAPQHMSQTPQPSGADWRPLPLDLLSLF